MVDKVKQEADAYMNTWRRRALAAFAWLDSVFMEPMGDGVMLTKLTISPPDATHEDFRAVLIGTDDRGKRWVAFAYGKSTLELVDGIKSRCEERGIKWGEDKPYDARKAGQ